MIYEEDKLCTKKTKNRNKYDVKLFFISFKTFKANIIEKLNG